MQELLQQTLFQQVLATFFLLLGLSIGSFLNVVIYRLPEKKSVVFPPSACPQCKRQIKWYENIPVLSYLFLGGKCAGCKVKISAIYPAVELLTGLLFLHAFIKYGLQIELAFVLFFISGMIVITGIDFKIQEVPLSVTIPGIILGPVFAYFTPEISITESFIGILVGAGILIMVIFIFYIITRKIGMGGGDVLILAMVGGFLGPYLIPAILFTASIAGIIYYIVSKFIFKKSNLAPSITKEDLNTDDSNDLSRVIPFGPFLSAAGAILILIDKESILSLFM